eukprot:jgi/Bigna1/145889/aug1.105_g20597
MWLQDKKATEKLKDEAEGNWYESFGIWMPSSKLWGFQDINAVPKTRTWDVDSIDSGLKADITEQVDHVDSGKKLCVASFPQSLSVSELHEGMKNLLEKVQKEGLLKNLQSEKKLQSVVKNYGATDPENYVPYDAHLILEEIDLDNDQEIDREEFVRAVLIELTREKLIQDSLAAIPSSDVRALLFFNSITQIVFGKERVSTWAQFLNFTNCMVGCGVLSMPYVFTRCGVIGGLILTLIACVVNLFCSEVVISEIKYSGKARALLTYNLMGKQAFGTAGQTFGVFSQWLELVMASFAFVIVIGLNIELLSFALADRVKGIIISAVLAWLLLLLDAQALAHFSLGSLLGIAVSAIIFVYAGIQFLQHGGENVAAVRLLYPDSYADLLISFGILMFCFGGATSTLPGIYRGLKYEKSAKMVIRGSYLFAFVTYTFFGVAGWWFFGTYAGQSFTENLGIQGNGTIEKHSNPILALIATFAMTFNKQSTLPIILNIISLDAQKFLGDAYPKQLVRFLICAVVALISIPLRDSFAAMSAMVGALATSIVNIIFPIACKIKMGRAGILDYIVLVAGVFFGAAGTLQGLWDVVTGNVGSVG